MTKVTNVNKPTLREVLASLKGKEFIVRLEPFLVRIKLKGQRWSSGYDVPYASLYTLGAMKKADEDRAVKAAKRKTTTRKKLTVIRRVR